MSPIQLPIGWMTKDTVMIMLQFTLEVEAISKALKLLEAVTVVARILQIPHKKRVFFAYLTLT